MAYKDIHEAVLALKAQVESFGGQANYLHLSPSLAEQIEACNGYTYEGMAVRVSTFLAHGEARITSDELGQELGEVPA
jgi:hypothetical protein